MGRQTNYQLARQIANTNSGGFPSRIPTTTKPIADPATATGQAAISFTDGIGGVIPSKITIIPLLVGNDNVTGSLRLIGWKRIHGTSQINTLWIPITLLTIDATASAAVGISGSPVPNTYRFADTIDLPADTGEPVKEADVTDTGTVTRYSPKNDTVAWVEVDDLKGCELFELTTNVGTATSLNGLLSFEP